MRGTKSVVFLTVAAALLSIGVAGQTTTRPCVVTLNPDGSLGVTCPPATTPPPAPVACAGTWGAWTPVPPGTWGACVNGSQTRQESRAWQATPGTPANGGTPCPQPETRTVSQACTVIPPPSTPNTVTITNATAHVTGGQQALQWTTAGTGNPVSITVEIDGKPTTAVNPPPSARSLTLNPQPTVTTLYLVTFNKRPPNTATWPHTVSSRHVTVVISGGGGGPVIPPPVDPPPVDPPPGTGQIVGLPVTAAELGECSAAAHDRWVVDGGDGRRYRVWHTQVDPTGCTYGHEHGDDPAIQTNAWVRNNFDGRMGYSAVRFGMDEPHNGYKIHVANIGEMNDEGRVNRNATTSMPHVGTGGPARFTVNHHSASLADWHENGVHHSVINTRFDTGTKGNAVCEPRVNAPTKDGTILGQNCKVNSPYEIWGMLATIMRNGVVMFMKFITPAIFDPITLFNRNNPGELVYAWDQRVAQYKNFPEQNWSGSRGCDRENYSQVGYHFNPPSAGDTNEEYLLDVRTNTVVGAANAWTTRLVVGRSGTGGNNVPFSSDILQFKKRRGHCDQRGKLSLTN